MCPLIVCEISTSLVHRHLNPTLNTLLTISFIPKGLKAVEKRGFVLLFLFISVSKGVVDVFYLQDYSILAVGLCV